MTAVLVAGLKASQLPLLTVSGLIVGSSYFLLSSGLVVIYRITNTMNFAQGGIGAVSGYCFYVDFQRHLRTVPAFLLALCVSAGLAVFVERVTLRGLRRSIADDTRATAISIGWMLLIPQLAFEIWGSSTRVVHDVFPDSPAFTVAGVTVTKNQVGIFVTMVVVSLALGAVLKGTPLGLRMRAVATNEDAARLLGISPSWVRVATWAIAGALGGIAGIFMSPGLSLNPLSLTLLVVPAYAVAVVGRLSSLWAAFIGAMVLGIGTNVVMAAFPSVLGLDQVTPVVLVMLAVIALSFGPLRDSRTASA